MMTATLFILFASPAFSEPELLPAPREFTEPELLPLPREVESHVRFERLPAGYQIILSRKASEKLLGAMTLVGDGRPYTDIAKLAVKELNDPEAERNLDFLAFVLKSQAPALKKSLEEKMGPSGAIVKVFGIEKKLVPEPPPLVKVIGAAFIPKDVQDKLQTGIKVINTTPLYWRVEGRK